VARADFRLVRLRGAQLNDIWPLPTDPRRPLLLGRRDRRLAAPDIDLSPDRRVSRRHARLWWTDGEWQIEDLGSTNGTLIDDWLPAADRPRTSLAPGSTIQLGETVLLLVSPDWHRLRGDSLAIELEVSPTLNLALAYCAPLRETLVSHLVARNWSAECTAAARLSLSLGPFGEAETRLPALEPGQARALTARLHLDMEALEARVEGGPCRLRLALDDRPLDGEPIECWVLAHNEWSAVEAHWISLASFVQPNHPLVAEVTGRIGHDAPVERQLAAVYRHLHDAWHLTYRLEPPTANQPDQPVQKIRLPHQLVAAGGGTCIDLVVLFAACLEQLGAQPLIAVVDTGGVWHAVVGGWRTEHGGSPAVAVGDGDRRALLDGATWLDATGCVRDPAYRCDLEAAQAAALAHLRQDQIVFVLDIAAARSEGCAALPFAGEPVLSQVVRLAQKAARAQAAGARTQLGTVVLLLGLLASGAPLTCRVLADVEDAVARLAGRLPAAGHPPPSSLPPSRHYTQVLHLARAQAKQEGSPLVLEQHVLEALLEVPSQALSQALEVLGVPRQVLRERLADARGAPLAPDSELATFLSAAGPRSGSGSSSHGRRARR